MSSTRTQTSRFDWRKKCVVQLTVAMNNISNDPTRLQGRYFNLKKSDMCVVAFFEIEMTLYDRKPG